MPYRVDIIDLCPRFLDFYERANQENLDPDARWTLWQEAYGFAGVPPTPEGQHVARKLLDEAWGKYPDAVEHIRLGAAALTPAPIESLRTVAELLECESPIQMQVIVFVGGFEGNPFVFTLEGVTTLALPIEQRPEQRIFHLPHEMTHVVHNHSAGMPASWERSVARLVLEEGLATRVTAEVIPGRTPAKYANELEPTWFDRCEANAHEILTDIQSNLNVSTSADITRYTIAPGPANLTRTAYYAGWQIIGALTNVDWSLASLAKVRENNIPEVVQTGINLLLSDAHSH